MLASEIYDILQSSTMSDVDNVNEMNSRRRKAQFFLGSTNKRAKTVVLHIDGLDDSVRKGCFGTYNAHLCIKVCEGHLVFCKHSLSLQLRLLCTKCHKQNNIYEVCTNLLDVSNL